MRVLAAFLGLALVLLPACSDRTESAVATDADTAESPAAWRGSGNVIEFTPKPYSCAGCEGAVMEALDGLPGIAKNADGEPLIVSKTGKESADAYVQVTIEDGSDRDAMIAKLRAAIAAADKTICYEDASKP